jgi:chloramphenicol 3-O phosphotransferase
VAVIVLNGTSSAGKSTLARELQVMLTDAGECWLVMSQDDFFARIPFAWLTYGRQHVGVLAERGIALSIVDGVLRRQVGPVGRQLLEAYRAAIAATARAGVNVIVDEVLVDDDDWRSWQRHLADVEVCWVGVMAPLEVVEQRERQREDRFDGLARSEYDIVHVHANYDLTVDTAVLDPRQAAIVILEAR